MEIIMKTELLSVLLAISLSAVSLSSCGVLKDSTSTGASTGGAGRETDTAASVTTSEEIVSGEPETDASPDETTSGALQNASIKIPTDLSFLDSVSKAHFSDKNADDPNGCWYPGSVSRDLTTGEVTYKWDRAADTLALLDKYGALYRGNSEKKIIYLTFDCGYEYRPEDGTYPDGVTSDILDTLKEKNAPGTFFVTGDYIERESELIKRMYDEGHIVGTHTLHHYNMTTLTPEEFVEEIKGNNDLLKTKIPDAPDMVFYRPPEGGANEWTLALAQKMGLTTVFWSAIEPNDHVVTAQKEPSVVLENDKTKLHNGCIYLLHAVSVTNAEILGDLIDYARAEGYEIAPLSSFVK